MCCSEYIPLESEIELDVIWVEVERKFERKKTRDVTSEINL
jgi:hypothetical protein